MGDLSRNFDRREFACKCGCRSDDISLDVVEMCQTIRDAVGVPVTITSGCRCESRNAQAGGVKGSYHTKGRAADLQCSAGSRALFLAVKTLHKAGRLPKLAYCKRYVKKNFIHIDCGEPRKNRFAEE
ncbi:MAG: hypothetical protein LBR71_02115 [Synergistaceae bacterium]|nr:hypothetical protein [Synergistaceae bacterium]